MLHGIIFGYVLLFCLATPCLAIGFFLRRQLGHEFLGRLLGLQILLLLMAVAIFTFYYFTANYYQVDPFLAIIPYEYFKVSPLLYGLWCLVQDLQPFLVYLAVSIFHSLIGRPISPSPRKLAGFFALGLSLIYIAESSLVPVLFHFNFRVAEIGLLILALNRILLFVMVGGLAAISLFWLRQRRRIADATLRFFGDLLAGSMGFAMAGFLGADILLNSLDTHGARGPDDRWLLMLVSQGPWLPSLLLDLCVLGFAVRVWRDQGQAKPLVAFVPIPEEFFVHYKLSAREREICALVAQGLANKDICQRLGISHGSVKNHISNIFAKLKIATRFEVLGCVQRFGQS